MKRRILLLILALVPGTLAAVEMSVRWNTVQPQTGEKIGFTVDAVLPAGAAFSGLLVMATNEDWELSVTRTNLADRLRLEGDVQCFAVGPAVFPGLKLVIKMSDGKAATLYGGPQFFHVRAPETDLSRQPPIQDLRDPFTDPFPWWLVAAGVVAVLLAVWFFMRRRGRKPGLVLPGADEIPDPWELAERRIALLRGAWPDTAEGVKEHVFLMGETLKQYLAGRSGQAFLELTSREAVERYAGLAFADDQSGRRLADWLARGDLAKFAKEIPDGPGLIEFFAELEGWLQRTESAWRAAQAAPAADGEGN